MGAFWLDSRGADRGAGTMDARRRRREFEERGFTVCRTLFSRDEIAQTLQEIHRAEPTSEIHTQGLTLRHNVFRRSAHLQGFISQAKVIDFLAPVVGPDFWVRWDQGILTVPGGRELPWHQDNGYNGLKREHFQLWVALTEINERTGLLWLQPGSHRRGVLPHQQEGTYKVCPGDFEGATAIEAKEGDVVLFSSLMVHRSSPNTSMDCRSVYVAEYMRLDDIDPFVAPPYFIAARRGAPSPGFVRVHRGHLRPGNHLLYLPARLARARIRALASLARIRARLHRSG